MAKPTPKYQNLLAWMKREIENRQLCPGDRFYSESELGDMFSLSRQTVRQALALLEQEGLLERRRGSGTFIAAGSARRRPATGTIGILSTYMDRYIFPAILKGVESVLTKSGYAMQLSMTHNQVENELRALRAMLDKEVDGIIVEPTKSGLPNPNASLYEEIHRRGLPLLFFNARYPGMDFPLVGLDDQAAGRMATGYLLRKGHRRIAGIFQSDDRQGHLRYAGYLQEMRAAGLAVRAEDILWFTTEDIPHLGEDIGRLRRYLGDCTAAVCYNDQVAFQLVAELRRQGVRIPDQLSLVGMDDAEIASLCEVPLTTIAHPAERLGERAATHLLRLIEEPGFEASAVFPPVLVERDSVRDIQDT